MADETDTADDLPKEDAATQPLELPAAAILAPGSEADGSQAGDPGDWQPPQVDEQGFAIDGHGLPINLRRRALVLADRADEFEDGDPAGAVSEEAIDAAREQLATYDEQFPSLKGMTKANMLALDETEALDIPDDALVDDIRDLIAAARPPRI